MLYSCYGKSISRPKQTNKKATKLWKVYTELKILLSLGWKGEGWTYADKQKEIQLLATSLFLLC